MTADYWLDLKRLKGPNRDYYRQMIGDSGAIYVAEEKRVLAARILPRSKVCERLD